MIPILFEADATDFTTNGIGALLDATKCQVTENRNGEYELTLTYRTSGQYYSELECERLILVKTSEATTRNTWQAFSIYSITDNMNGTVDVLANHISYRANYVPIKPFGIVTGLTEALNKLNTSYFPTETPEIDYPYPFVVDSDIVNETTQYELNTPKSLRNCLGGEEGSLLDRFASRGTGEYLWDNYNIHFLNHRGSDKGYEIRYGKNLSEFSRETDTSEIATGCIAYYTYPDDEQYGALAGVTIYSGIHYSDLIEIYPVVKTVTIDATQDFQDPPTPSQLETYAQAYVDELAYINETTEIDFYDPDNTVKLCDTVHVHYSVYSGSKLVKTINYDAKVIKTVWDVLKERYTKITIGENKSDLASTLEEKSQDATNAALQAVDNKIVSVYQHVDTELGEITDAVAELREDVFDTDDGLIHTVNEQGSAIQQNTEAIATKVTASQVNTLIDESETISQYVQNLTTSIEQTNSRITSSVSSLESNIAQVETNTNNQIQNAIAQQTTEFNTTIDQTAQGINTTISEIRTQTDSLSDTVDKYEDYITIDTSINGITIGKANSNVRGKFDNDSLDFIDQNDTLLAWLSSDDGLGADMLSVGSSTTRSQRWNIITSSDGNTLRFTRHS